VDISCHYGLINVRYVRRVCRTFAPSNINRV
jgi:hypothetical protein